MTSSGSAHVDTFAREGLPSEEQLPDLRFTIEDVQYPPRLNCGVELLDTTIDRFGGGRPCLVTPEESWTYGQTRDRVNRIAGVLVEDLGVVPGNRVLLRGPNNAWMAACWLAVMKAGAIAVTTMPLMRARELAPVLAKSRPTVALCDHRLVEELASAAPDLPICTFGGDEDDLANRMRARSGGFTAVDTAADDIALIAFTSGTTGEPKGCMHFHRDVLAIADTFSAHVIKPTPDDLFTGSPPLAFTFGLGQLLVFPLRAGAATLLLEQGTPPRLAEAIARHGATVCATAPTAYRAMLQLDDLDLRSLRRGVSAGETLPASTWHAFHERTGLKLIDGIGSTEMLHVFIASADDDIRPGSTGRAVPGYEAMIVDDDGQPVPDGTVGRLAVRGPTGCRYLADARQADYVQRGWNLTGDAFSRDEDGYFWFQARSDDLIISAGYNIAGPEVEDALLAHEDVAEAAVVGLPDEERGAVVTAFVVPRDGVERDEELVRRLQDHVKQTIAPYKYPRRIEFRDELPRTQTGKLQRFRLRDQATD
ncbi:AMP-binding protein [Egicoccus sp. AB-alg2]|uniref:AMP-binding protein n=1 Tax=Egicoccus sp. AB-alg2 TaxID=3242693 RepID=UPI00359E1CE1